MQFNQPYNRNEFLNFLRTSFLPEDFTQEETQVDNPVKFQYTQQVTRLGECESLGLVVYEVRHSSMHDARVGLTKEAFRLLADVFCERALIFFVPQDDDSNYRFSLIEITLEQKADSAKVGRKYSNPHRYSYYLGKGIAYYTPNKYLNEAGRVVNIDDLRGRFSVEVLTKAFYQELGDWYAWAVKIVRFPDDLKTEADNEKYNAEAMIRLITRLIFVWFIKQRHLVPDEFFDEQYIADNLIKGFSPNAKVTLFGKSEESHYYKGILQNLFFAMLNSPITPEGKDTVSERRFRNGRSDYDNNKLMRHEDLFKNPDLFVKLANKYVPFLNGGLFDCLDDKDKGMYVDAFTDRENIAKQLIIPDYLFFGEDVGRNIDLSEWYGDAKKKKVSARGIIDILKRYNFTVEENTPFDQEVSLDPELLGKVFENLLASYNPETQTTARKQTGSFYTPREIVQYMVDESLIAHLKRTVGDELETEYRKLTQYTDEPLNLTAEQKKAIMQSLYNCKVLDPACGSGAFPMGMLQQMVHILNRIDPDNVQWKEMMLNNAISETSDAYQNASDEERAEMVADIERSFNESINRPDYARKLYLIENCIYGVDIQPIAIQISKLRFFISLVVDQKTNNNPVDNFGIRPLPNLEAKFVAANTLIGLEKKEASLFDSAEIKQKEKELKEAKHRIFGAKTVKTKRKYKERVATLRTEIADMLEDSGFIANAEAQQLASWDMFDQNATSPFFDPEWMFGVGDGFDVVIGNPPYVDIKGMPKEDVKRYFKLFTTCENRINLYAMFIEQGKKMLSNNGVLCYINPNSMLINESYQKLRNLLVDDISLIIKLPDSVFLSATVETIILMVKNKNQEQKILGNYFKNNDKINFSDLTYNTFDRNIWKNDSDKRFNIFTSDSGNKLLVKIQENTRPLYNFVETSLGITPYDKAKGHSQELIKQRKFHSKTKKDDTYVPLISGKNIIPYYVTDEVEEYISYGVWLGAPREKRFFTEPRIVVRQIVGGTSLRIIAGFADDKPTYFTQVGFSLLSKTNNELELKYILGLLNSKLISYYHKNKFLDIEKVVFQKILIANAKQLPIKTCSVDQQQPIIDLVDKILAAKKADPRADTSAWEAEIDFLVYKLYGLSYDEVLVVDPETSITREEYEK